MRRREGGQKRVARGENCCQFYLPHFSSIVHKVLQNQEHRSHVNSVSQLIVLLMILKISNVTSRSTTAQGGCDAGGAYQRTLETRRQL